MCICIFQQFACININVFNWLKIKDQWSPVNPEGKKKYERDFLLELQNEPQSRKKPENLPDVEAVLKDTSNKVGRVTDI